MNAHCNRGASSRVASFLLFDMTRACYPARACPMNEAKDGFGGGKRTIKNTPVARVLREQVRARTRTGGRMMKKSRNLQTSPSVRPRPLLARSCSSHVVDSNSKL